jgi:hypothetical protein
MAKVATTAPLHEADADGAAAGRALARERELLGAQVQADDLARRDRGREPGRDRARPAAAVEQPHARARMGEQVAGVGRGGAAEHEPLLVRG